MRLGGNDRLTVSEVFPFKTAFFGILHPFVIEFDDVLFRAVVFHKAVLSTALPFGGEFQNVSYRRPAEAIQALVVVPDNAEIAVLLRDHEYHLFLHIVGILIFVDHHITELFLYLLTNDFVLFQQFIGDHLDGRKVHRVFFGKQGLVEYIRFCQYLHCGVVVFFKSSAVTSSSETALK